MWQVLPDQHGSDHSGLSYTLFCSP